MSARKRSRQTFVASIMLVAFALRALLPPGFMPAGDRPVSFEICWEGLPAEMLAHGEPPHAGSVGTDSMDMASMDMDSVDMDSMDMASMDMHSMSPGSMAAHSTATSHRGPGHGAYGRHPGSPSHSEHCVFGTACSAGPTSHLPLPGAVSPARPRRAVAFVSIAGGVRLVHLPQPRAPPGRLS